MDTSWEFNFSSRLVILLCCCLGFGVLMPSLGLTNWYLLFFFFAFKIVSCQVGEDCFLVANGGGESVGVTATSSNPSYSCVFASQHNASLTIQSQFLWSQPDVYLAMCGIPERTFPDLDLTLTTIYVAYNQVYLIHLPSLIPLPYYMILCSNTQSGRGAVVASYDYPASLRVPSSYYAVSHCFGASNKIIIASLTTIDLPNI
jgi:hypothetical protein